VSSHNVRSIDMPYRFLHIEAKGFVLPALATHDRPSHILGTISRPIRSMSGIDLLSRERVRYGHHEFSSSCSNGILCVIVPRPQPYGSGGKSDGDRLIFRLLFPTCHHNNRSCKMGKVCVAFPKSVNDDSELVEI
jgi:hypothetical protein